MISLPRQSKTARLTAKRSPWSRRRRVHATQTAGHLVAIILDANLQDGPSAGGPASLLALPLGTGSVLDYLLCQIADCASDRVVIVSASGSPATGEVNLYPGDGPAVSRMSPEELGQMFAHCETSDDFLVIDPRCWPVAGYDFAFLRKCRQGQAGALHVIAAGEHTHGAREHVECDADGYVRRVQRLYDPATWPGIASTRILCSLVPGWAVRGLRSSCLEELRPELAARGVLTRDIPIHSEVNELTRQAGFLELSSRMIHEAVSGQTAPGYSLRDSEVLVGRQCQIHPTVRLVAPVIVQEGAVLEEGVRVVGPTVIGAGARILRNSIVTRSIIGPGAIVAPKTIVCQQVALGNCRASATVHTEARLEALPAHLPTRAPGAASSGASTSPRRGAPRWESPTTASPCRKAAAGCVRSD